tara:strand:- start:924 stop:1121 length:198 start_codon:yes stop_codon:yes gene_type:complete
MATSTQKNKEQLIRVEGELKLLKHEIQTIRGNHLVHLDQRVSRIEKIMWGCTIAVVTHLIVTLIN